MGEAYRLRAFSVLLRRGKTRKWVCGMQRLALSSQHSVIAIRCSIFVDGYQARFPFVNEGSLPFLHNHSNLARNHYPFSTLDQNYSNIWFKINVVWSPKTLNRLAGHLVSCLVSQ